jgi:hypothetical protein
MNKTSFTRFTLATLLAAAALPVSTLRTAQAQPPSGSQNFTTRIYIQNPNPNAASGIVNFFDEMGPGNPRNVNVPFSLNPNGSTEILVGSLTDLGTWKGSAVISADQPVVAASIQVPSTGNYGHMMANAFTSAEGTSTLFLTTFLRNVGNEVSLFGVQNIENEAINIRARFISVSPSDPQIIVDLVLQANTSKFFDAANAETTISPGFPGTFNGSAVVTATKVSDGSPARIVGISETRRNDTGTDPNRFRAYAFEAIPLAAGAETIYIPSALCRFGAGEQTTFIAVQNLSFDTPTVVTVNYAAGTNQPGPATNTLAPLAKWSFNPCQTNGNLAYSGAATITSSGQPIAAVAKNNQTSGPPAQPRYSTAFIAQASGARRLAVPYVRWSPLSPGTDFRSLIAIQNLGSTIPAGQLIVRYYASNGTLANTCTSVSDLATGAKVNSNVAAAFAGGVDFNCTSVQPDNGSSYSFTGSAVIEGPAGANVIALIRNTTPNASTQIHTEDFNAILLP